MGNVNNQGFTINEDGTVNRNPNIEEMKKRLTERNDPPKPSGKNGCLWGVIVFFALFVLCFSVYKCNQQDDYYVDEESIVDYEDGPGAVAEKAMNDLIDGNYESYVDARDIGEDTLTTEEIQQVKEMSVALARKAIDEVKNGDDEDAKKQLASSCRVVDETVYSVGDEARVILEVTSVGGDVRNITLKLKKNNKGEWKITESDAMMPGGLSADDYDTDDIGYDSDTVSLDEDYY